MFCAYTRPRYQVSVYRTIGPLVLSVLLTIHYDNRPMQYTAILMAVKMTIFQLKYSDYFSYICSKHRLWVHNLDEAVLMSTHNLCFRAKIRKNVYPCKPQFYYIK